MKNKTLLAAIALTLVGCKKDKFVCNDVISECLKNKIEQFKTYEDAEAILTIVNQSEKVYWFKHGNFTHTADGCDQIYNNDCALVCNFGGKCLPIEINCPDWDSPDWEIIWEK